MTPCTVFEELHGTASVIGWLIATICLTVNREVVLVTCELSAVQYQFSQAIMATASSSRETRPRDLNSLVGREMKRPKRDMQEMEQNARTPTDAFERHFDTPSLPSNLVFDFESLDANNRHSTPESILLNSVLYPGSRATCRGCQRLVRTGWEVWEKRQR